MHTTTTPPATADLLSELATAAAIIRDALKGAPDCIEATVTLVGSTDPRIEIEVKAWGREELLDTYELAVRVSRYAEDDSAFVVTGDVRALDMAPAESLTVATEDIEDVFAGLIPQEED